MTFLKSHFDTILEVTAIIVLSTIIIKLIDFFDTNIRKKIMARGNSNLSLLSFMPFINNAIKAVAIFIILATVLQNHGYSISSLIAGFGITGLAVGFAAKEAIANIFGSISLLTDRVYEIGDYIVVNDIEGTVEDINFRSTKIRTPENILATIPNNIVANVTVKNVSAITQRRLDEVFRLSLDINGEKLQQALDILQNIIANNPEFIDGEQVFIEKIDSTSINIRLVAFIKYADIANLRRIKIQVIKEVLNRYQQEEIKFATFEPRM